MLSIPTKSGAWRRVLVVMADAAYGTMAFIALVISMGYRCLIKPLGNAGKKTRQSIGTSSLCDRTDNGLVWEFSPLESVLRANSSKCAGDARVSGGVDLLSQMEATAAPARQTPVQGFEMTSKASNGVNRRKHHSHKDPI
jgi:hypothetical protein